MKIRTGRLVAGEVVSTYRIKIWTAASWTLTNNNLSQVLLDKAYDSAGIKPGLLYTHDITCFGGVGAANNEKDEAWSFQVIIKRRDWKEVTE